MRNLYWRALWWLQRPLHWLAERDRARYGVSVAEGSEIPLGSVVAARLIVNHDVRFAGPIRVKGPAMIEPVPTVRIGARTVVGEEFAAICDAHSMVHPNVDKVLHRQHGFCEIGEGADITIGPGCWIGDRVTILPGAVIGAGAVIAAGAVVTNTTVAPYTIVGGVPARPIGQRCAADVADVLADLDWWDWTPERTARNRDFFECDIRTIAPDQLLALVRK